MGDELTNWATERLQSLIPVVGHMGIRVVDVAPGRVATEVPIEGNANHIGTMYAGVLFAVAEVLGGVIATATYGSDFYAIVKGVEIRYLKPAASTVRASATLDEATTIRVRDETEARGKSDYVLEVEVTDEQGTTVARTRGDYQLRRREAETGQGG